MRKCTGLLVFVWKIFALPPEGFFEKPLFEINPSNCKTFKEKDVKEGVFIDFTKNNPTILKEALTKLFSVHPAIKKMAFVLDVQQAEVLIIEACNLLKNFTSLTELYMELFLEELGLCTIGGSLTHMKNLEKLGLFVYISDNSDEETPSKKLQSVLSHCPNIKTLELTIDSSEQVPSVTIEKALKNLEGLESFTFKGKFLEFQVIETIKELKNLSDLSIDFSPLDLTSDLETSFVDTFSALNLLGSDCVKNLSLIFPSTFDPDKVNCFEDFHERFNSLKNMTLKFSVDIEKTVNSQLEGLPKNITIKKEIFFPDDAQEEYE